MKKLTKYLTVALFGVLLIGCGDDFTNTAPIAQSQTVTVAEGSSKDITLNATDADGDTLTYSITVAPTHGVLSGTAPNLKYTPNVDYSGEDSFTFKANDGIDDSNEANVTITIFSNTITFNGLVYKPVTSPYTGKVWLDRNIGASRVCTTISDTQCYGDYYQWGRDRDGHEESNSTLTTTQADDVNSAGDKFIYNSFDWASVDTNGSIRASKWAKIDGSSVCPPGYRVPTIDEFRAETVDQNMTTNIDAFNSFLKIATSGFRHQYNGEITGVGTRSDFWTTSLNGGSIEAGQLYVKDDGYITNYAYRAYGQSIRCIDGTYLED